MFTGLVEGLGTVRGSLPAGSGQRLVIEPPAELLAGGLPQLGDSIAVNGCCLTIVDLGGGQWSFDVGEESLNRTNLGELTPGDVVNLERALAVGQRLGGHFVQGHIDGRGTVASIEPDGEWITMRFRLPAALGRYLVEKGSIAIDGVSLTVVEALPEEFSVMLIPHTLAATTLGRRKVGDTVNLEVDLLAKYVERLLAGRTA
ncbi:Riboflavin synthase [Caulifigura coniformis]|uniref:Riboflavin synthase n=1 Tax=Caulifigura coniformis TaxID=2527983 RepID=A0A517SAK6_9PLAN|nr:riboflavin synthase [Caulifigura coniformis]QDT53152.1 Riboflavin synthase [Caulifigura coniformis]